MLVTLCSMWVSESVMHPGELVEELLVQGVAGLSRTRRHEDVATNVLMYYLAVCSCTAEGNVDVPIKLNGYLIQEHSRKKALSSMVRSRVLFKMVEKQPEPSVSV